MISNSLDIYFIQGDVHGRSCKKVIKLIIPYAFVLEITWFMILYKKGFQLTHWGRATHICVSNLTTNGSDNGLSPGRPQSIIWTNAGILLIGPLGTNFNEILIQIRAFSLTKIHLKMSSGKWRPFCLSLYVLTCGLYWDGNVILMKFLLLADTAKLTGPRTWLKREQHFSRGSELIEQKFYMTIFKIVCQRFNIDI